jgi:hypothetical protein
MKLDLVINLVTNVILWALANIVCIIMLAQAVRELFEAALQPTLFPLQPGVSPCLCAPQTVRQDLKYTNRKGRIWAD